jgi:hypothetical protein
MPGCCRPDSNLGLDTTFRIGGGVTPLMAIGSIFLLWLVFSSVKAYW